MIDANRIRHEHRTTTVCAIIREIEASQNWSMIPLLIDAIRDAGAEVGDEFLPAPVTPAAADHRARERMLLGRDEPREASVLFVGGPRDGVIEEVELRPFFRVALWGARLPLTGEPPGQVRTAEYRLLPLRGESRIFYCYLFERMTADEAMQRLLASYEASRARANPPLEERADQRGRISSNFDLLASDPRRFWSGGGRLPGE